jgi:drug/metabolite transporter (DMT)-like permease
LYRLARKHPNCTLRTSEKTAIIFLLSPSALIAILASGIFGQALGDALFVKSMKMIGSARAFPIAATNPLLTTILAVILLGEHVTWLGATGTVFVVVGVCLLAFRHGPPKQPGEKTSYDTSPFLCR